MRAYEIVRIGKQNLTKNSDKQSRAKVCMNHETRFVIRLGMDVGVIGTYCKDLKTRLVADAHTSLILKEDSQYARKGGGGRGKEVEIIYIRKFETRGYRRSV